MASPKRPTSTPTSPRRGLPSRQEILDFIAASPVPVGKTEIARAFKIGIAGRVALKGLLREIERSGAIERDSGKRLSASAMPAPKPEIKPESKPEAKPGLPEIGVLEIEAIDIDGEITAKPVVWHGEEAPPRIVVVEDPQDADVVGQRVVAKLTRLDDDTFEARIIRLLGNTPGEGLARVVGIFHTGTGNKGGHGGRIEPTDRRIKSDFIVKSADTGGAVDGELVAAVARPARRMGLPEARIVERLGSMDAPRAISLIAIHSQGIPVEFPPEALRLAEQAKPVTLDGRTDLRECPLVTIDGADARDFDDAVWAEADTDPENPGGWHILVAIADVSWYVRPNDALDLAAQERGNSVYFPDRVVPMLPEALSNELCSLKPAVDRACLAVHMWLDAQGGMLRHRFVRGLMRSAARLTYEQVQMAQNGQPDETTSPLLEAVIQPLYRAFAALDGARAKRGTLELDLPERKVVIDEAGKVTGIEPRARLDSHRLIEEFMIAANVAAAETLERLRQPCMYRVHDQPDPAKLVSLREFLEGLEQEGLMLGKGQVVKPKDFNRLLKAAAGTAFAPMINELVLRCQAQAVYAPENLGHFGLALQRYAHFTSPIRRYADLLVHRALVAGHPDFGAGALPPVERKAFAATGQHISDTERRAAAAERSAIDRYTAAYLQDRIDAIFPGRINGVTRFGLFVTLTETGADGLVPISTLPNDYYIHDEKRHELIGRRSRRIFHLGAAVTVQLKEANQATGGLLFRLLEDGQDGAAPEKPEPRPRTSSRNKAGKAEGPKQRNRTRRESRR